MNREDIVNLARECGLVLRDQPMLGVEHFAALIAAAEREACAKVCEDMSSMLSPEIAAAIRNRGQA